MVLKQLARAALAVAMATATVIGLSASPAAADGDTSGRAYVHEYKYWVDEGDVSTSRHTYSNATCLWQKILWADGFLLNEAGIDGIFGGVTAAATAEWKDAHGLNDDGTAGIRAWSAASSKLRMDTPTRWRFVGWLHTFIITVNDAGQIGFWDDDIHRLAGYNYRTCS